MLITVDYRIRPKFLSQAEEFYKKVSILQIVTKKPSITADISKSKKIIIQNQSIINFRI